MGVNFKDLYVAQPDCGEDALEIVDTLVRSGAMSVIVVVSLWIESFRLLTNPRPIVG